MKHFKALKAVLFALALVAFTGVAFGTVKAQAADDEDSMPATVGTTFSWSYDSASDKITITQTATDAGIKYKVLVIGKEDEVDKKFTKVNYTTKEAEHNGSASTPASIQLDDKNKGIKLAESKDAYLFVSDTISTSKKALYTYNVKVSGTKIKKITATINYAKVTSGSTATAADIFTVKKQSSDDDELQSATVSEFVYSVDGGKTWEELSTVTGGAIYVNSTKTKATTMLIRYKGTDDSSGTGIGVRPSKAIKVKIALEKKAPTIKLDVKKSLIVIKNGYDYAAVASGTALVDSNWYTILPYNKSSDNSTYKVQTNSFVPYSKIDEDEAGSLTAFTNKKIAGLSPSEVLVSGIEYTDVYMRKSASTKAPATKSSKITIKAVASAPTIATLATTGSSIKIPVTNASVNKFEYVIVHAADYDSVEWNNITFKKFESRTKFAASNLKTTAFVNASGDKVASELIENGDVIVIRCQGDAKKNILPSATSAYTIALASYQKSDGSEVVYFNGFTVK